MQDHDIYNYNNFYKFHSFSFSLNHLPIYSFISGLSISILLINKTSSILKTKTEYILGRSLKRTPLKPKDSNNSSGDSYSSLHILRTHHYNKNKGNT